MPLRPPSECGLVDAHWAVHRFATSQLLSSAVNAPNSLSKMDRFGIALFTVARSRLRCSACHPAHTSCIHFRCCAGRFAEEYRRACAEWRPQWVAGLGGTGKPCLAEASARVGLHAVRL
jgi:hypothetical protein